MYFQYLSPPRCARRADKIITVQHMFRTRCTAGDGQLELLKALAHDHQDILRCPNEAGFTWEYYNGDPFAPAGEGLHVQCNSPPGKSLIKKSLWCLLIKVANFNYSEFSSTLLCSQRKSRICFFLVQIGTCSRLAQILERKRYLFLPFFGLGGNRI